MTLLNGLRTMIVSAKVDDRGIAMYVLSSLAIGVVMILVGCCVVTRHHPAIYLVPIADLSFTNSKVYEAASFDGKQLLHEFSTNTSPVLTWKNLVGEYRNPLDFTSGYTFHHCCPV